MRASMAAPQGRRDDKESSTANFAGAHHREANKASQHACAGRRLGICRTSEIVP
jgi:hypothetical protein